MAAPRRSALVTGSDGGLGYAVAESLGAIGFDIILHGLGAPETIEPVRSALAARCGIAAVYCQADLTDPAAVDRLMQVAHQAFGGPDVVVNNAVVRHFAPIEKFALADWQR